MKILKLLLPKILLLIGFFIVFVSIIAYGRGYRLVLFDDSKELVTSTGILSLSAYPKGAKVFINGAPKGVTDINLTLPHGEYKVEVKKEGYSTWAKTIKLKGEIVITLDVLLFPKNPSLVSVTNLGIVKAIPHHQAGKIVLFSDNNDPEKDGIYVFDSNRSPLSFYANLNLLILKKNLPADVNFQNTDVIFSPDSQQAIFKFTTPVTTYSYLFSLDEESTDTFDISNTEESLLATWEEEKSEEIVKLLETYPKELTPIALKDFSIIAFSPDQTKILYKAKVSTTLPLIIDPPLIGSNQTPEVRTLQEGQLYIYDKKEDKNFPITLDKSITENITPTPTSKEQELVKSIRQTLTPSPTSAPLYSYNEEFYPIIWHSDSKHLTIQQQRDIVMIDYDGSNKQSIYAGPFEKGFFFITTDGKLFILTNLNPQYNQHADIYEIGIK